MSRISRPALRYHGGKFRLAPWILEYVPDHECYVEPFAGAASVLLRKEPSPLEVLNDLDGEVVNFFRVLRERPKELVRAIDLTPFARAEYEASYAVSLHADPLERARLFFVRSWQTRGGPVAQWRAGWRFGRRSRHNSGPGTPAVHEWSNIGHLWPIAERLKHVQIECDDALTVIARYDTADTVFYVDPPYLRSTRSKWAQSAYRHELSDEDHRRLARRLHKIKGMALISGYPSELYAELYSGWRLEQRESLSDAGAVKKECLWISPRTVERLEKRVARQGTLFEVVG